MLLILKAFNPVLLISNSRNIGQNPAPPSRRLFGDCGKIFKNNVF
jgi:hypothetical protein